VLGVGIGMGLYDPAFAALTWLYGREARSAITGITLIAGFASTIGWPLSAVLLHEFGWRAACLIWAGLNILLAAPLNWLSLPRHGGPAALPQAATASPAAVPPCAAMPILAFFFAATWFVQGAMAAHLPGLLQAAGASSTEAIAAAALVGPAQVGARLVEFGVLRSFHPIAMARFASVLHPIGAALLVVLGAPGIIAFAVLHGAGNGLITIAKGTLPLALFGPHGYGLRSGLLSVPARVLQSASPFLFGLFTRPGRVGGGGIIGWAMPRRVWIAVPALPTPDRRCAPLASPRLKTRIAGRRRYRPDGSISSHGRKASCGQFKRHDRALPCKWRVLSAFYSV
jgi:hypothetical protein